MDGILLQTVEGLGEAQEAPLVRTGCEIWEWLQGEKEEVTLLLLTLIFSEFEPGSFERLVSSAASPHSLHNRHCKMVRSFA